MKLDSMEKRIGIVLIIACVVILLLMLLAWIMSYPQIIGYHTPKGEVLFYRRGYMESMIVQWLAIAVLALPLGICGVAFMLGYGSKLLNWIKHGTSSGNDSDSQDKDSQ